MKKKLTVSAGLAIALLAVGVTAWPRGPEDVNKVGRFMRLKLEHSKNVLEGLAKKDFELIAKNSNQMVLLSHESNWDVLETEEYLVQSAEFRRAGQALTKAAKDKNLDAAALAFVDMTMKCINCHKYVRDVRMARFKPQGPMRSILE